MTCHSDHQEEYDKMSLWYQLKRFPRLNQKQMVFSSVPSCCETDTNHKQSSGLDR